ncbi:MAG: hypothetical protein A2787_03135 [Omnitrophica WOR_2 bacterium RIFCSPHIGHO2_01_FULL_48_9]|nr:MAG: hypothetical protein A2787_03135 [Omnitrophica WOR_2 bacterium RIFCSPHIGHO2_01_FULL_48_9]
MNWDSKSAVSELRRALRAKENLPVRWSTDDGEKGEGKVLNISASGLLLDTNRDFSPIEQAAFSLESIAYDNGQFLPKAGRLVWSKSQGARNNRLCGIEFVQPEEKVISHLRERVQAGITKTANARRTRSLVGSILFVIMAGLTIFAAYQYNENYRNIENTNQVLTSAYEQQASLSKHYADELGITKTLLADAERDLEAARQENAQLQELIGAKDGEIAQNKVMIDQLTAEVKTIKERLRILEGDVVSMQEGRSTIAIYKEKVHKVKVKIHEFKQQAQAVKVAAQKERDRIAMALGNNGYFTKGGKPYNPNYSAPAKGVEINVEFVK